MAKKAYMLLIYFLLYFPIAVLIIFSVNSSRFSLRWHGFSLSWYQELFHDKSLWIAFFHSSILGLSAAFIATFCGVTAGVQLFLYRSRHQISLFTIFLLMILIPDLVLAVSLLIFFNFMSIPLGFCSLLIAHITFCIPFVALTINGRIHTLDRNIYFSALDLGASKTVAFCRVLLPLLLPAVISAFILCFTLSFDDVIISYFVAGPDFNILPLTIYSLVRAGVTPELNALCTITFLISMILVIIAYRLSRNSS